MRLVRLMIWLSVAVGGLGIALHNWPLWINAWQVLAVALLLKLILETRESRRALLEASYNLTHAVEPPSDLQERVNDALSADHARCVL